MDELGWDRFSTQLEIALFEPGQQTRGWATREERQRRDRLKRHTFILQGVAHKRGLPVFVCSPYKHGQMPDFVQRCQIERHLTKSSHHHLIIFTEGTESTQVWQWPHRTVDRSTEYCEHEFRCAHPDEELLGRLTSVAFSLDEEEVISLVEVLRRVQFGFYFTSKTVVGWRVRLHNQDMTGYSEVVQSWVQQAYVERGLTRSEEQILARAAISGDEKAKQRLIATHLYLPLEMAWKLKQQRGLAGIELEDLIQEGFFGLWHALKNFDPNKGQRFQSHAGLWVRSKLDKAILSLSRMIRFPAYIDERFQPIAAEYAIVEDCLIQREGREPTRQEMAAGLGISSSALATLDVVRVEYLSLESLREQDDDAEDSDVSLDFMPPMSEIERRVVGPDGPVGGDTLEKMLATLTPREHEVISLRFGLNEREELTLEETARRMRVTRERIRQIESSALSKLRKLPRKLTGISAGKSKQRCQENIADAN